MGDIQWRMNSMIIYSYIRFKDKRRQIRMTVRKEKVANDVRIQRFWGGGGQGESENIAGLPACAPAWPCGVAVAPTTGEREYLRAFCMKPVWASSQWLVLYISRSLNCLSVLLAWPLAEFL